MERIQKIRRLRKGRCTVIMLLLVLTIMLVAEGLPKATASVEGRPMQTIVVAQGDNLWALVQKHCDYKGDIRKAIYEVRQINGLKDATIVPGQVLYIPQK